MSKICVRGKHRWDHGYYIPRIDSPPHMSLSLSAHGGSGGRCPVIKTNPWAPKCVEIAYVEVVGDWSVPYSTDRLHVAKGGIGRSEGMSLGHETSWFEQMR